MKKMNSILMMLLVAITSMVFTSCEKEQDELIIGTWTAEISEDYKEYENGELIYSDIDTFTETWTFQENGQLLVNYEGQQNTYTYSVQGDKLQTTYAQDFSEKDYFSIKTLESNRILLSVEGDFQEGSFSAKYQYTINLRK